RDPGSGIRDPLIETAQYIAATFPVTSHGDSETQSYTAPVMSIQSPGDLHGMRHVGRIVALTINEMHAAVHVGMTTAELDAVAASVFARAGARSAPQLEYGFPGTTCISVNDEIVHGIPGSRRLQPGDVLKIDVTAESNGYIADAATTVLLPPYTATAVRLKNAALSGLHAALTVAK